MGTTCIILCFTDVQQSTGGNKEEEFDHQKGNTTEIPSNDVPSNIVEMLIKNIHKYTSK
jgi:hypothetical protein